MAKTILASDCKRWATGLLRAEDEAGLELERLAKKLREGEQVTLHDLNALHCAISIVSGVRSEMVLELRYAAA